MYSTFSIQIIHWIQMEFRQAHTQATHWAQMHAT